MGEERIKLVGNVGGEKHKAVQYICQTDYPRH